MGSYYIDSSGLVKRYISETGTGWVRGITDSAAGNEVIVLCLTGVEVVSALVCHSPPFQLAAGMEVHAQYVASGLLIKFISADRRLNTAATAEGLVVDNPQSHP